MKFCSNYLKKNKLNEKMKNNLSNNTYRLEHVGKHWHYLNGIIQLIFGILSLILNILMLICLKKFVCFCYFHFIFTTYLLLFWTETNRKIKRPGTLYLVNLAIGDMLKASLNLPFSVTSSFKLKWVFNESS